MPDLWTEDPRSVATYDVENTGRRDHDFYLALADELGARDVVDLGCGTGVFCVDLAHRGIRAVGVDPAATILEAARSRPGGDLVTWVHGTAADVAPGSADLVVMMGHVAQYFVDEAEWAATLAACRRILRDGGRLTFETRNPDRGWPQRWTHARTTSTLPHPDGGEFTSSVEVVEVVGPPTSFTETHVGRTVLPDGDVVEHAETLRFRNEQEIRGSLAEAGFVVEQVWGDWGRGPMTPDSDELIVLARR